MPASAQKTIAMADASEMEFVFGQPPRPQTEHIGGGEKALEAFRVQSRPVLIFPRFLVHVFSVPCVYFDS